MNRTRALATTKRFEAPGGPALTYDEYGSPAAAPAIVLLHGGGGHRKGWSAVAALLADRDRVLVPDARGCGGSDRTPGQYKLEYYAADVYAFVEQVAGRPVVLVGHSAGGITAAHVAGTHPDLVSEVFLEDPPLLDVPRSSEGFFGLLQQLLRDVHAHDGTIDELVATLQAMAARAGSAAQRIGEDQMRGMAEAWFAVDPEAFTNDGTKWAIYDPARPIPCRMHLLRADPTVPGPVPARFLAEHEAPFLATHPRASVEFVEGAGHSIHAMHLDRFMSSLEAFLAERQPQS